MADETEKKPKTHVAPNGLHVVRLSATHRFEQHNPGEIAGFPAEVAEELLEKKYASPYFPTAEELAKFGIKPTAPAADAAKKDGKPAGK